MVITSFIAPFIGSAINLGIPQIGREYGVDQFWLNWVVTSYLLTTAAFLLPFGRLADVVGRKKIYIIGMFFFALTSLGCGLAFSFPMLLAFRALQGIACAMVFGTSMAILTSVVPPFERGRAMGFSAAVTYIGLASGPVLGGFICSVFNWRGIFYFNFILSALVFGLAVLKLKGEWKGAENERFDIIGGVLWVIGILLFLYGLSDISAGFSYVMYFVVGLVILIVFIGYGNKASAPLLPMGVFLHNRAFAFSNLAALINYSATFALAYLISLYLQNVQRIDISHAGLILLVQPVVMAVFSPLTGRLSDRINPQILASLGMGITTLGLFFFIFLGEQTSVVLIVLNMAFMGVGFALFSSPNTNAVMSSVDRTRYGLASSTLGTMRLLGQSLSMTIVALVTSLDMKNITLDSPSYVVSFLKSSQTSFIAFTILCFLGVFASLARGKRRGETSS